MTIADRFSAISSQIPSGVTLIAVSKTHDFAKISELYALGHRDFGENYVQELLEKAELARQDGLSEIRWHLIGPIQKNKINGLLGGLDLEFQTGRVILHTLDSLPLIEALKSRVRSRPGKRRIPVFFQINIRGEAQKSGCAPDAIQTLVAALEDEPQFELQGLMVIPANDGKSESEFKKLRALESGLGSSSRRKLSMGMSEDYLAAIAAGSTHVRIGTAIFGPRSAI